MPAAGEKAKAGPWLLQTDGAARGNPGPASIAYVLTDGHGRVRCEHAQAIGQATNNEAEYRALIAGMERALAEGAGSLVVRSDSQLLVRQMQGRYQVRSDNLLPLFQQARALAGRFVSVTFEHVGREANQRADQLANHALDGKLNGDVPVAPAGDAGDGAGRPSGSATADKSGGSAEPAGAGASAGDPVADRATGAAGSALGSSSAEPVAQPDDPVTATTLLRVRYGETDQMGFVYYANYLDWFTVGRTNYLRRRGVPYALWEAQGIYLPIRRAECTYRRPARYDQVIAVTARLTEVTPVRIVFSYEIRLHEEAPGQEKPLPVGALMAEGMTEHAVINSQGGVLRLDRHAPELWAQLLAATGQDS